jgi:phenylacetate-coenzyme A ligase PaaK-like adenylate-forming protein
LQTLIDNIFSIINFGEFRKEALSVFQYQATENEIYRTYLSKLNIDSNKITELDQIPFLPIEFFKTHQVVTLPTNKEQLITSNELFTSSGTTGMVQSKHYVNDVSIYEKSYLKGFELFYGNVEDYCVLALLPSYLERDGSSLIYMADDLIKKSKHPDSGFYLNNYDELISKLTVLESRGQKTILLGVTYALLDLIEKQKFSLKNTIIMETGGMKGKRKEMLREELHTILCNGFGVNVIHSEYGMTELLSQAYSKANGVFYCPPWMRVFIRDVNDPFAFLSHNKTGGINVIDLANINSCSFIATQDLGKIFSDTSFEVLGRFDNSDIRGCNLLVQ